jgi:ABC-type transport system involved in cytochrome bd biosynthesis fused ATPase/permease subunit
MDGRKISMLLAWAVSIVMFGSGIVVLAGWFLPKTAPNYLRVMLGIVFLLMGVYRFLMTRLQAKQAERLDD